MHPAIERMDGADAGFLYLETPTMHMHTLKIAILEPAEHLDFDSFVAGTLGPAQAAAADAATRGDGPVRAQPPDVGHPHDGSTRSGTCTATGSPATARCATSRC